MVSETWYMQIESTIFTMLQYNLVERLDAPFPSLNCTTSSEQESIEGVSDFPAMYVHLLPLIETGEDLRREEIAAVNATVEVQIFSNKSESECVKIMTEVIRNMKNLRFRVAMFPDPQTSDKKYFAIARFTRLIAGGDTDIVPKEE